MVKMRSGWGSKPAGVPRFLSEWRKQTTMTQKAPRSPRAPTGPRHLSKRSSPSFRGRTAITGANGPSAGGENSREMGIALSLLKYFYWIELGIRSYLRSRNNLDFSRAEGLVVASILLNYSRPSDISRQLGVSRQAIHVTIQQMKKKGIVDLVPDPHDGRIKQVVLTDLAKQMNDDGIVAMNLLWKELGKRLGHINLVRAAKVLRADWGPPVLFDSVERGTEWWHQT
jgi:DNA-binding MarR family transcriptional regulator